MFVFTCFKRDRATFRGTISIIAPYVVLVNTKTQDIVFCIKIHGNILFGGQSRFAEDFTSCTRVFQYILRYKFTSHRALRRKSSVFGYTISCVFALLINTQKKPVTSKVTGFWHIVYLFIKRSYASRSSTAVSSGQVGLQCAQAPVSLEALNLTLSAERIGG